MVNPNPDETLVAFLVRCLRTAQRGRSKVCASFEGVTVIVEAGMNAGQVARAYMAARDANPQ